MSTSFRDRIEVLHLSTRKEYRGLFDACERLSSFALSHFPHWEMSPPMDPQLFSWFCIMRALKTFDSVLVLADCGYGVQSLALSRSVFEDAVAGWWCSQQPVVELLERIRSHDQSVAMLFQSARDGREFFPLIAGTAVVEQRLLDEFAKSEGVKARTAKELWTGTSVGKMVAQVNDMLPEGERYYLRLLHEVGYMLTSLMVHQSPGSLATTITGSHLVGGVAAPVLSRRPSTTGVHDALSVTYLSIALLARLPLGHDGCRELDALLAEDRPLFKVVPAADLHTAGRNGPCPCGSGRKVKLCHGRGH